MGSPPVASGYHRRFHGGVLPSVGHRLGVAARFPIVLVDRFVEVSQHHSSRRIRGIVQNGMGAMLTAAA
jgi:hypothetical protein